jgi:hypothetical protein
LAAGVLHRGGIVALVEVMPDHRVQGGQRLPPKVLTPVTRPRVPLFAVIEGEMGQKVAAIESGSGGQLTRIGGAGGEKLLKLHDVDVRIGLAEGKGV